MWAMNFRANNPGRRRELVIITNLTNGIFYGTLGQTIELEA